MSQEMLPRITDGTALFLDFDGTLVELASQPEAVQVPAQLVSTLTALSHRLGGALAMVSGRRLLDLDHFLSPLQLPAAAEHGARCRDSAGRLIDAAQADMQHVLLAAQRLLSQHPGLKLEQKTHALSLHYRQAPEMEKLCLQKMREAVALSQGLDLMQGKCVIDIKPAGVSKGTAIAALMAEPPFAGRQPVFAGDDVTDEAGFEEVQRLGGHAIKVGPGTTLARHRCDGVASLMAWLQAAVVDEPASTTVTQRISA